ncbi:MAG: hypothetical protein ABJ256_19435 [Nisaea sp.]
MSFLRLRRAQLTESRRRHGIDFSKGQRAPIVPAPAGIEKDQKDIFV